MKKHIFSLNTQIVSLVTIILFFTSCEKVINIDLNTKEPQIVIEGTITDQPGPYNVKLTQTVNFNQSNIFPTISNAIVTISDNTGYSETLVETTPGNYSTSTLQGVSGRIYTLKVDVNGKEYLSTSTMPARVDVGELTIVTLKTPKGNTKNISIGFADPAGIPNYYRFMKIINSKLQSTIFVEDDLLQDGNYLLVPLLAKKQVETKLAIGDTVTVIMQSIDKGVYESFRTLLQLYSADGPSMFLGQATSPANPLSNINNGALGYFNACSLSSKKITIY